MQVIAWLLMATVVLAYVSAILERYGQLLLVLAGEVFLGALALIVLAFIVWAIWSWLCHWWEQRQIRAQARRAIHRTNSHYEKSRAEMEQIARLYHLRKGIGQ